jgi:uncharacterized protein with HEPN domain
MGDRQRDLDILQKIVDYCNQLDETKARFGNTLEALESDTIYKNAAAMCILQIGELTAHLTVEFKAAHPDVPWQDIKAMRNIAAHHYGDFRLHYLWNTMNEDIAPLRDYCNACIAELTPIA